LIQSLGSDNLNFDGSFTENVLIEKSLRKSARKS